MQMTILKINVPTPYEGGSPSKIAREMNKNLKQDVIIDWKMYHIIVLFLCVSVLRLLSSIYRLQHMGQPLKGSTLQIVITTTR